jgi:hypothetical protein
MNNQIIKEKVFKIAYLRGFYSEIIEMIAVRGEEACN